MNPISIDKILWRRPGQGIAAAGVIPQDAEFFKDHFPGFPVLPGVLALEMLKQTAEAYLRKSPHERREIFSVKQILGTKFSHFLKPGDPWESHMELLSEGNGESRWSGRLMSRGRVALTSKMILAPARELAAVSSKEE